MKSTFDVSTYEIVTSSPSAISLIARIVTQPLPSISDDAFGSQSWLCHPMSTESAEPTLRPPRVISHALVRIW